jgi:hypothetical protein
LVNEIILLIYLSTAIGLRPDGSSTVHIYTHTLHVTTQLATLVWRLSGCTGLIAASCVYTSGACVSKAHSRNHFDIFVEMLEALWPSNVSCMTVLSTDYNDIFLIENWVNDYCQVHGLLPKCYTVLRYDKMSSTNTNYVESFIAINSRFPGFKWRFNLQF